LDPEENEDNFFTSSDNSMPGNIAIAIQILKRVLVRIQFQKLKMNTMHLNIPGVNHPEIDVVSIYDQKLKKASLGEILIMEDEVKMYIKGLQKL